MKGISSDFSGLVLLPLFSSTIELLQEMGESHRWETKLSWLKQVCHVIQSTVLHNAYVYQIVTLYTLNVLQFCQLHREFQRPEVSPPSLICSCLNRKYLCDPLTPKENVWAQFNNKIDKMRVIHSRTCAAIEKRPQKICKSSWSL